VPTEKNPAQIELLETKYRFETNGDSRKEVHARVRINNELGVRQFARLNFDFNRSFQAVEIPLVRITHASGGIADILPSAITDNPNPAVVDFPAYHDVRVKSVRILGLEPADLLEYRVITTTTHHPLAPDFWLDHTFDRTGVVSEEHFQVVLPASIVATSGLIVVKNETVRQQLERRLYPQPSCGMCSPSSATIDQALLRLLPKPGKHRVPQTKPAEIVPSPPPQETLPSAQYGKVQLLVKPSASTASIKQSGEESNAQISYSWNCSSNPQGEEPTKGSTAALDDIPDIEIGKNSTWSSLSYELFQSLLLPNQLPKEVVRKAAHLTVQANTPLAKTERIYNFISQKIKTIDLPLGATGFRIRPLEEILASGYATQEDKFFLFEAFAKAANLTAGAVLVGPSKNLGALLASPATFTHLVIQAGDDRWLDPSLEVAPFGALPASYRGSTALFVGVDYGPTVDLPPDLPFVSTQNVDLDATLEPQGKLTAKVKYTMRGDNELLLRVAFHQTPKEKWKDVAQLLAISDGFRGQITNVTASDPYATHEPFQVEYEISQPKFVDWSKKSVRVPALLPLPGLPEAEPASTSGSSKKLIDLGTPLDIQLDANVQLPEGTTAQAPVGTSVERDYATFSSKYSTEGNTIHATRKLHFILREIPTARAADWNAFLHAVQSDQTQLFTLHPTATK